MANHETQQQQQQHQRPRQHRRSKGRHAAARPAAPARVPLRMLLRVASVAGGIQFGWALQLSLLTPYVQQLGIPHVWASIIWLCGPLSGLLVQPLVGHLSDRCTSRFGRRRPFILGGALSIVAAVLIIGHSADIGWWFGDTLEHRPWAVGVFVFGFWILDVANNVTQGPCRALLGDLTGKDQRRTRVANAYYSLFMAIGNILGYATGSYSGWYKVFAFTLTPACNISCANLKSAFFLDIIFIAVTTYISIVAAKEVPLSSSGAHPVEEAAAGESGTAGEAFLWELFGTFRYFSTPVWTILTVTALTWIGWFPFLLFDTDWMGREIYGGEPNEGPNYDTGVRMGALGLLLNSVVLGVTSVLLERLCRKQGPGFLWGISNILMAVCFISMLVVTYVANNIGYVGKDLPPTGIVIASLIIFTILGFPLAITYSVPYALISTHIQSLGLGQGLSMGVLNLAIVFPQMVVSLGSGPWDQLFGGGNSPAFGVAAVAALASGLIAVLFIPRPGGQKPRSPV
ncbi:sucrose transport protein SUC4-like [Glycine soja]|uniref:Sucrose transport protein SUC4 isoform A n=1 Tax=Glycine soja TaxID=3848 RepID=A0A445KY46_GLYSO|nr:sucrose transport protein SUC4-like [Glycine soja]RZC15753.1 Sucrose transport protein SUC4 isoform A [Glycine soja]RZC15754.1 Sucrose transport protein SUC4 isoform B [Glycine soja]